MRIHTDATLTTIVNAARIARVDLVVSTEHGSRSRARAFEVKLEGVSRRRPNGGSSGAGSGFAATWDQWGVFLAHLFEVDPTAKCWAYDGAEDFANKTADRFGAPETFMTPDGYRDVFTSYDWPDDAHGDHTFRYDGRPFEQACTKCSAVRRWS